MTTTISDDILTFFEVEDRNYHQMLRDDGYAPSPTLMTAWDSLSQAPYAVLLGWFEVDGKWPEDDGAILAHNLLELGWLICTHGPHTPLDRFIK